MSRRSPGRYVHGPEHKRIRQKAAFIREERIGSASFEIRIGHSLALGSLLFLAGFASGLVWPSIWGISANRIIEVWTVPPVENDNEPRDAQITFHLAHTIPDARGLGVSVRRRQCKTCRQARCLCVFWRGPFEGRHA